MRVFFYKITAPYFLCFQFISPLQSMHFPVREKLSLTSAGDIGIVF